MWLEALRPIRSILNIKEIKMKVRLKQFKAGETSNLTTNEIYDVVEFCCADDCIRLINNEGEPVLCEKKYLEVVDDTIPADWAKQKTEDGYDWYCPKEFLENSFFERYFDYEPEESDIFEKYRQDHGWRPLSKAAQQRRDKNVKEKREQRLHHQQSSK